MPKYRLLTASELQEFEKEFIEYLVVNGIDAESWQKIKKDDAAKAGKITALFSDVVFEKILRKTEYLLNAAGGAVFAFRFLDEKAQLYIVEFLEDTRIEAREEALVDHLKNNKTNTRIHFQEKAHDSSREKAIFDLMEAGAWISEGTLFAFLDSRPNNG